MDDDEVAYAGVEGQRRVLEAGLLSSSELVRLLLGRIAVIDPALGAFREVWAEDALSAADEAQSRIEAGGLGDPSTPLLGIPFAVKDSMDVAGRVTGQGASRTAQHRVAPVDSEIVARLRRAGAIPLGRTTCPELCMWPDTASAACGITRNPWDTSRTAGGSSGGSAAAVAAGLVPFATASDGGGSIRIPAACCGLFGLKPERGRVPLAPLPEHWGGSTVYGVLARTVSDAALLYDVVADTHPDGGFSAALDVRSPMTVGWSTDAWLPGPEPAASVVEALEQAVGALAGAGHEVVPVAPRYVRAVATQFVRFARGVHEDCAGFDDPAALEPRTRRIARIGGFLPAVTSRAADIGARRAERRVDPVFRQCDVLLTPALAHLPGPAGATKEAGMGASMTAAGRFTPHTPYWNLTGHPAAAVPVGLVEGVPVAVQAVAAHDGEHRLLRIGRDLEEAFGFPARRPPSHPPA